MKKFILEESEITRILSMHKVIKEQSTSTKSDVDPLLQKLRESIINGCLSNGKIYLNKTKNTYFYRGVKQSTKQEIDFFPDMTYNFVDGSKKGKWFCNLAQKTAKEAATTDSTNNLKQMKDRGWMEYSELTGKGFSTLEAKEGKYETTKFDMGNGNKITLYRPKNLSGKKEQFTQIQKDFLQKYYDAGYKLKSELTLDEIGSFEQLPINFPDGSGSVVLYKNKEDVASDNRYKKCRKTIEDFAQMAKDGLGTKSEIDIAKSYVRRCLEQAGTSGKYLDLGATKKNLEFLRGDIKDEKGKQIKPGSPYFVR